MLFAPFGRTMLIPFRDRNPVRSAPVVTYLLVASNVLAFLWLSGLSERSQQAVSIQYGFIPARISQLREPRLITLEVPVGEVRQTDRGPVVEVLQYRIPPDRWQVLLSMVTCMFLHGGWLHLLGNMWFLWLFGNNVEDRLGAVPYLLFYLGGGLIATAAQWATNPESTVPVIGASGAVAAVLGAYAITWPWARVETLVFLFVFVTVIDVPALLVLGAWFVGQILEASQSLRADGIGGYHAGVAWWAHIGGFLAGLAAMPVLNGLVGRGERRPAEPLIAEIVD